MSDSIVSDWSSDQYTSETLRSVVREELAGKVSKDDTSIFKRLDVDQVHDGLVEACFKSSAAQNLELFEEIESIAASASMPQQSRGLFYERTMQERREIEMYPPLQHIFHWIVDFSHPSEPDATRNITIAPHRRLKGEEYTTGFPKVSPDGTGSIVTECDSWIDVDWFIAVRAKEAGGLATQDTPVSEIVCQAADYARLHLSSRPFQLFSVALLIFGPKFMVGVFDRDGVSLSPTSDFCDSGEGFRTFIKVVRRLVSPRLSDFDLGRDPTATPLRDSPQLHAAVRDLATSLGASPDVLPYVVLCPKECTTMTDSVSPPTYIQDGWVTIGPPIWVSLSLIGRGTYIWRVIQVTMESGSWSIAIGASISILKNTWRSSDGVGEAFVYRGLNEHPPGVARFLQGGDVLFPGTEMQISVHNLRCHYPYDTLLQRGETNAESNAAPSTTVLHRLILQTIGRPLWHFVSYLELLKAFRAAIVAHQQLLAHGILHRDISAGNIMISASSNPVAGEEGFLMDLEFARIDKPTHGSTIHGGPQCSTWSVPRRGVQMTGTVQFMAREILASVIYNRPVEQIESHDLESFAWVFAYAVLRRLLRNAEEENTTLSKEDRIAVKRLYDQSFGGLELNTVLTQRQALNPFRIGTRIKGLVPTAIGDFMDWLGLMVRANDVVNGKPIPPNLADVLPERPVRKMMTHTNVILVIDTAIQRISIEVQQDE
ncbi:hypothetical protein EYR38_003105 [Pleurotus pulmonarius]|nr:hypothetical protein EYR38_003105 [Pleurotus pulmonarius]